MTPTKVSFTPDSRRATIALSTGITLFDVVLRTPIAVYSLSSPRSTVLSPDGRMIATVDNVDDSGIITLIDTGLHHGIPVEANQVAIQPDNEHFTTVSDFGKVAIYSIGNPEPIIVRNPANDWPRFDILSSNGLRYAFADEQAQKIRLLDVSSSPAPEVAIEGNRSDVLKLAFDPSGDFLACVDKFEIIVWSAKNRAEVSRIPLPEGYTTRELAVSPGGQYVAVSSFSGAARLWDTKSNDHAGTALPVEGEQYLPSAGERSSMSFSPDGRWLSISGLSEIRLWDLNAGEIDTRRIPIGGNFARAFSVKFSPDSSLLAVQEGDGGISVWNVRDILSRGTVSIGSIEDFAFTSDNSRLAVSGGSGVFVEPFDASWAMRHVCRIVGRNITHEEWNKYLAGSDYVSTCPS